MTPASTRRAIQWLHVAAAMVVGVYLYSPWAENPSFSAVVLFGVFPAMGLSGAWLAWPLLSSALRSGRPKRNR